MKTILSLFLALLLLNGCKTKEVIRYVDRNVLVYEKKTETVRDTFIKYLPQKQSVITTQKSNLATDFSFSLAFIDSLGLLNHSIENFEVIPSKVIEKNNFSKLVITKTITIEKTKIINQRDGIWWIGLFFIIGCFLFCCYAIIK